MLDPRGYFLKGTMETYKCAACHKEYEFCDPADWSDDDAKKEYAENFSADTSHDTAVVCDDCYKQIRRTLV